MNVDWTIQDRLSLRSITAWRELHDKTYTDFSSGASEGFRIDFNTAVLGANAGEARLDLPVTRPNLKQKQFSQEFQLMGSIGDSVDYLAGVYYFWEKADEDARPLHHIFSAFPFGSGTVYNLSAEHNRIENDALAIFSQFTWTPNTPEERLHLTLGGRISRDSREAERQVTDWTVIDQDTSLSTLLGPNEFSANPDRDFDDTSLPLSPSTTCWRP